MAPEADFCAAADVGAGTVSGADGEGFDVVVGASSGTAWSCFGVPPAADASGGVFGMEGAEVLGVTPAPA